MFNFLKKPDQQPATKTYPAIVHEIHQEFLTAGDKILQEAEGILAEAAKVSVKKGERLAAAGFTKTPEAVMANETKKKIEMTKMVADLVTYYAAAYPFNKFITEEQVKAICQKYGLVMGNTTAYKGFVPEEKLAVIEKFRVNKKDLAYAEVTGTKHKIDGFEASVYDELLGYISKSDIKDEWAVNQIENGGHFFCGGNSLSNPKLAEGRVPHLRHLNKDWGYIKVSFADNALKICAPLKDMEVSSGQEVNGYKIQNIPEPVVLQPVNGGYLVITAWGDEASDEIVVNQINN